VTFDAGRAVARYDMDNSGFVAGGQRILGLYAQIQRAAQQTGAAQPRFAGGQTEAQLTKQAQGVLALARAEQQRLLAAQRVATEEQRTAQAAANASRAQQQLARDTTNAARAEQQLARDTANTAAAQDRAAIAALKRAEAEDKASRPRPGPTPAAGGDKGLSFGQALGAFGIATIGPGIVGGAIGKGVEAGREAIELERIQRLTKELTGTQAAYNQVIEAARRQQELYGGSLKDNVAGIQGLVVTARSTGAELQTLINLAQRLAVLDPAQGAEGARIALSEVLSGDPRSLSRRYEIPLSALEKIKDESKPVADRLAILDQYLNKIGITSATVTDVVTDQAKAFNQLNTNLGDLQTRAGAIGVKTFAPAVEGANLLLKALEGDRDALAEIEAKSEKLRIKPFGPVEGTVTNEDIAAKRRQIAADEVRGQFGQGENLALRRASQGDPVGNEQAFLAARTRLQQAQEEAVRLSAISDDTAGQVNRLLAEFGKTGDLDRFAGGLQYVRLAQEAATRATDDSVPGYIRAAEARNAQARAADEARAKLEAERAELGKSAVDAETSRIKTEELAAKQRELRAALEEAAGGSESIDHAAQRLALLFPITADAAAALIKQLRDLNAEGAKASSIASGIALKAQENQFRVNPYRQQTQEDRAQTYVEGLQQQAQAAQLAREQAQAAAEARDRQILAIGSQAQKVAVLKRQLAEAQAQYGKTSAQAIDAETRLTEAQQQGGASRARSAALTQDSIENRLEDSYRKQLQLQEDYQLKAQRAQEDYDIKRGRNQEDFQRRYLKLLAEGKRDEARRAKEEFDREAGRDAQDFARQQARAAQDEGIRREREQQAAGTAVDRLQDRAAIRGVRVPGAVAAGGVPGVAGGVPTGVAGAPSVVRGAVPVDTVAGVVPPTGVAGGVQSINLAIDFAPIQLVVDGKVIAEGSYEAIRERLTGDLVNLRLSSAPRSSPSPLAGPRAP
jgi:hypothetical protein